MAKSNGKKISRKSWNSQAVKTSPQFSCLQTVKSRTKLLSKTSTICWTLMKYPTCSRRIKKLNWLKWYAQWWKIKADWKKALQHNCTVSLLRNARRICTSYWPSVQSATTSVPESACSHLWSTAAQSTGSKTGHRTPFFGWPVSFSTQLTWSNPCAKNAFKWSNTTTHRPPNGPNNSWVNSNETITLLPRLTLNWLPLSRNFWMKNENKSSQISSSTKMGMKRLL